MKVLVRIPLSIYSGYGNDGIGLCRALMRMGADVYVDTTMAQAPLPVEIAMLLTKTIEPPFDLTIVHVDPNSLVLRPEVAEVSGVSVGWTMWEYSNFLNLEEPDEFYEKIKYFDALIAYDEVTAAAFAEVTDQPIITLQGGFEPEQWPEAARDWFSDRFGFFMVGALSERKDPFVAISAFQELKQEYPEEFEPAELHLKTVMPGLHSSMEQWVPKLRIHYATWPNDLLWQFYAKQHVLLAPSRGEGKNMPALEFQSTGGVVVATNWGGHKEWLNPDFNYALDYTLAPVEGFKNTYNARASVSHLKEIMLHLFRNRAEAKVKGELAAQIIPASSSWDAVLEKLLLRIRDLPGGENVWTLAQSSRKELD